MADLSINEQSNAAASISSASSGEAVKIGHKESANTVDSSSELAQILGSLQNSLDVEDDYNQDYEDSLDLANKLLSDSIDSKNVEIKDLQKNVILLSKKLSENPAEYLPSLCVDGKLAEEKVSAFLKTQTASIQQQIKDLISGGSDEEETTTTTTTTEDDPYAHSGSYLSMCGAVNSVADSMGYLEYELAESMYLQTDMNSTLSGELVESAANAVVAAQKEADRIARLIERMKKKAKQNEMIGHVISGVSVALACCTMNPVIIGMTVALVADQEAASATGGKSMMDHTTGGLASGLHKAGMSPKAAKLTADIAVTVAVAGAAAGGAGAAAGSAAAKTAVAEGVAEGAAEGAGEAGAHAGAKAGADAGAKAGADAGAKNAATSASRTATFVKAAVPMGAVVGSMMASSTKMWSDAAECYIADHNIDPDSQLASDIRMGMEIGGAVLSIAACGGAAGYYGTESLSGLALEGTALYLQTIATTLLVAMEVGANATSSVLSYQEGVLQLDIARAERSLAEIMANMQMSNTVSDQLSSLTDTVISGYNSEISNLGTSLNSLLAETGRLNRSTVLYA